MEKEVESRRPNSKLKIQTEFCLRHSIPSSIPSDPLLLEEDTMTDRRAFLKFLASSALFASTPSISEAFAQTTTLQGVDNLIGSAADALDVFDFEPVARKAIPPPHCGYMSTAVEAL